jgi:hypothetical protein
VDVDQEDARSSAIERYATRSPGKQIVRYERQDAISRTEQKGTYGSAARDDCR